jgi:hypothetical protein
LLGSFKKKHPGIKMEKNIKKILIISSLVIPSLAMLLFLFYCGAIVYFQYIYPDIVKEIPDKIMNCARVKKVSVFEEDLSELQITIDFNNGGRMELWNVNENLKGNITITRFDNYKFYLFSYKGLYSPSINLRLLNLITDNRFITVYDIVANYNIIHSLIYSWPNISELKRHEDKNVSRIVNRNHDLFPSVIFDDEEIFFAVKNYDDSGETWRWEEYEE